MSNLFIASLTPTGKVYANWKAEDGTFTLVVRNGSDDIVASGLSAHAMIVLSGGFNDLPKADAKKPEIPAPEDVWARGCADLAAAKIARWPEAVRCAKGATVEAPKAAPAGLDAAIKAATESLKHDPVALAKFLKAMK